MKLRFPLIIASLWGVCSIGASAAVLTVTTTNNVSPAAGQTSLLQALSSAKAGDEIRFNIPGTGPFYIATPASGYPLITNDNVTINGYSQPGASPNSNSILSSNNAKIQIVLDSREGGHRVMTFPLSAPNDQPGYDNTESTVIGAVGAKGVRLQGLSFLGVPRVGDQQGRLYFVSFARGASGSVTGCWLGVAPDGKTVAGASDGITGFRYRGRDSGLNITNTMLVDNLVVGVEAKSTNAVQQFNVIAGMPGIPVIVEGNGTRISGNFLMVLPDGLHDFDVALDPALQGSFEGAIQIGRGGNDILIGTDGDGINDENERNIFGGMVPQSLGGYPHLIHFYGPDPGTNIVVAGNYFGVGVDGKTRFTNGVAILNGAGNQAQYRIGSNLDGVSDALEGNLIFNNYPPTLFPASSYQQSPEGLNFFSELESGTSISLRGNSLVNNFPFPVSPVLEDGGFLVGYYSKALLDPTQHTPTLTNSTRAILRGTLPLPDPSVYSKTIVDVYLADPMGMTNGMAAEIPALPQGFVQGLTYLGSFTNAGPSATFEQNISRFNVPAGAQLTITANYVAAPSSGGGDAGSFTVFNREANGSITLAWDSGLLQSASAIEGPWADEETSGNSLTVQPVGAMRFYRLQAGGPVSAGDAPPLTSPFSNAVTVQ